MRRPYMVIRVQLSPREMEQAPGISEAQIRALLRARGFLFDAQSILHAVRPMGFEAPSWEEWVYRRPENVNA